ncbi:MAG: glutathione synthase [Pseudomonadales bacterium]|nr:glutathione synthase [Pseudomonadales bacterium]
MKIGMLMDAWEGIKPYKDTSLAILEAAAHRGHELFYFQGTDLSVRDGIATARVQQLYVDASDTSGFLRGESGFMALAELDAVLMRKDPPFDLNYIYMTYALELAERQGVQVVNRPASLRDCNEKFFISQFPQCCAPTMITADTYLLKDFHAEHGDIILKPLDGMGGQGIFRVGKDALNLASILEMLSALGQTPIMAQRYIPAIIEGDKRILMIDGEAVSHALARIPKADPTRGNLAAGGIGRVQPLSERDQWICAEVGPELKKRGLRFVGIDVIGDYLTEINVTSPTCVREIEAVVPLGIAERVVVSMEVVHASSRT